MNINKVNNLPFKANNNVNDKDKKAGRKNFTTGVLAYATICAIYPHDYEKLVDRIDINFKNLSIKDKAVNVSKFALPFLGYPLLVLLGMGIVAKTIDKFERSKTSESKEKA